MYGYSIVLFIFPPYVFVWILLLVILHFVVLIIGGKIVKITEGPNPQTIQSLFYVIPLASVMSFLGTIISLVTMLIVSYNVPFSIDVHSEWGIHSSEALFVAFIYSLCVIAIYAVVYMISLFSFVKRIANKRKRRILFTACLVASALLLEGINAWIVLSAY